LEFYPKFKENYRIYYNIALSTLSYQTRGHYEQALGYVSRCLELNPNFEKAQKTHSLIKEKLEGKKKQQSKAS
jgi:tetratricopeptide (TPR) repeat protein